MTTETKQKNHGRDFFLYLLLIITLYVSVTFFLILLFQYINFSFPDELQVYYESITSSVRTSMATLLIMWPVFLILGLFLKKELKTNPEKENMSVRRYLIYVTIFASALTIIIDLIILVYNFLGGELTVRFTLKTLAVLFVSACLFGYFFIEVRKDGGITGKTVKILAVISSIVIFVAIVSGFFIIGSPKTQRELRFDEQRLNNLINIQSDITRFIEVKKYLPKTLAEVNKEFYNSSSYSLPKDPVTNNEYEYNYINPAKYSLCANFYHDTLPKNIRLQHYNYGYDPNGNWEHTKGRVCFERVANTKDVNPFVIMK